MAEKPEIPTVALFGILVLLIFYLLSTVRQTERMAAPSAPVPVVQCHDGQLFECTLHGCNGQRQCSNGHWSACVIEHVCVPGSKAACSENSCIIGYKVCNPCGSGYGGCIRT